MEAVSHVPTKIRKNFSPRQIRKLREIHKKQVILVRDLSGYEIKAVVLAGLYKDSGSYHIRVQFIRNGDRWEGSISLADHNVVGYRDRTWNPCNWLERT